MARPKHKKPKASTRALTNVRKYFPDVERVNDADTSIVLEVTAHDSTNAKRKDHNHCAMALAVKRQCKADGVIIALQTAYVIKNGEATRYSLPESVSREVVSFDRKAGFAPGKYELSRPRPSNKIGVRHNYPPQRSSKPKPFRHQTTDVRAVLGSDKER